MPDQDLTPNRRVVTPQSARVNPAPERSAANAENPLPDPTRGRSAGTVENPLRDPTRGRSAGTVENAHYVTRQMGVRPQRGGADVPYLSCRECGLSIRSRDPLTDRTYCPRCRARGHHELLQRTPLPLGQSRRASNLDNADTPATR